MLKNRFYFLLPLCVIFFSCRNEASYFDAVPEEINGIRILPADTFSDGEGILGLVRVPEMNCLVLKDTSSGKSIKSDFALSLQTLLEEYNLCHDSAASDMPGTIIHSNDTAFFVYEVFISLKEKPKRFLSSRCTWKKIPGCVAVLCHHKGPYEYLFISYGKLRAYLEEHQLMQEGPMREIYFTDPTREPDSSKWITKIYVPVVFRK